MLYISKLDIDPNPWRNDKHFIISTYDVCSPGPNNRELYKLIQFKFEDENSYLKIWSETHNNLVVLYTLAFILDEHPDILKVKINEQDINIEELNKINIGFTPPQISANILKYYTTEDIKIEIWCDKVEYQHQKCLLWYYESVYYPDGFTKKIEIENWKKNKCL